MRAFSVQTDKTDKMDKMDHFLSLSTALSKAMKQLQEEDPGHSSAALWWLGGLSTLSGRLPSKNLDVLRGFAGTFQVVPRISRESIPLWLG